MGHEVVRPVAPPEVCVVHVVYDLVGGYSSLAVLQDDDFLSSLLFVYPGLDEVHCERYLFPLLVYDEVQVVHSPVLVVDFLPDLLRCEEVYVLSLGGECYDLRC